MPFVRLFEPVVEMVLDESFLKLATVVAAMIFALIYFVTQDDKKTEQAYKEVIGKKE